MSSKLVLVLNCGSSSLKFAIINPENGEEFLSGLAECFNLPEARLKWKMDGQKHEAALGAGAAHSEALNFIVNTILAEKPELSQQIAAIGHRIVHGGEKFTKSVVITDEVIKGIEAAIPFAPLHNPAHLIGIEEARKAFPHLINKMVAVFDTAFHQTMPKEAYMYALPYSYYEDYGIRRYGFHGTSHKYVAQRCAELMGKHMSDLRIITCHLGNGSSVSAIKGGRSIDTTMGFTPLSGLIMGTRTGDIDPAIVPFLMEKTGMTYEEIDRVMNKESGVLGISGVSNDFRVIEEAAANGNKRAQLALNMFHYKVRRVIGAFAAVMGGVDAIIFTAGIGENGIGNRDAICNGLEYLGTRIDSERNNVRGKEQEISVEGSKVKIFVIPTNEEIMIARDTQRITAALKK